jgi:hypothetical protein
VVGPTALFDLTNLFDLLLHTDMRPAVWCAEDGSLRESVGRRRGHLRLNLIRLLHRSRPQMPPDLRKWLESDGDALSETSIRVQRGRA